MNRKPLNIAPIQKREALPEQIARQLAGLVKCGDLQPGDRLPAERVLANQLGVGRPTLREALRALQLLGIIDIRHGGGVFVSEVQPDSLLGPLHSLLNIGRLDLAAVLEARRVIEGALLAFVAKTISDRSVAKLERNLAEFERVLGRSTDERFDHAPINKLAEKFREILIEAADNPILTRAMASLDILSAATRCRMADRESLQQVLENHKRIVAALSAHDPTEAQRSLEAHIDHLCAISDVKLRERNDA